MSSNIVTNRPICTGLSVCQLAYLVKNTECFTNWFCAALLHRSMLLLSSKKYIVANTSITVGIYHIYAVCLCSRVWQLVTWTRIRLRHFWYHRPRSEMVELLSSSQKYCCSVGRLTEHEYTRLCFEIVCGATDCVMSTGVLMLSHEVDL